MRLKMHKKLYSCSIFEIDMPVTAFFAMFMLVSCFMGKEAWSVREIAGRIVDVAW